MTDRDRARWKAIQRGWEIDRTGVSTLTFRRMHETVIAKQLDELRACCRYSDDGERSFTSITWSRALKVLESPAP